MIKRLLTLLFFITAVFAKAQEADPAMADTFRSDGKIYVVIAVLAIILISIFVFLIIIERKVKKLEDRNNSTSAAQ
jgi:hypothetical protein